MFTHRSQIDSAEGPLELTFEPEDTVLLDVGADGESLSVKDESWRDPFEAPHTAENDAWVAEHGKWAVFDKSQEQDYRDFISRRLTSVSPLRTSGGNVCGVRLAFEVRALDFVGSADEALVMLDQQHDLRLAEMKVHVGEEIRAAR